MSQDNFLTKSGIKRNFGLSDRLIDLIGEPDWLKSGYYKKSPPMRMYSRKRVEKWISENKDLVEASNKRKKHAQQAIKTKRANSKQEIAKLLKELEIKPTPPSIEDEAFSFFQSHYEDFNGILTAKGLCSYIRHNYTNYHTILNAIKGKVGAGDLYQNAKLYLCCVIVRQFNLSVHPADAAGTTNYTIDTDPQILEANLTKMWFSTEAE